MVCFVCIAVGIGVSIISILTIIYNYFVKFNEKEIINFSGKHVIITGGSKGIGKALAILISKHGGNVTIVARNLDDLNKAKEEIEFSMINNETQKVKIISLDLGEDYEQVKTQLNAAENDLGPCFMLINAAGTSLPQRFHEAPIGDFKKMMNINYLSAVHATRACIDSMKSRQEGHIVFFSSIAGLVGLYGFTGYSASKFALIGLAQALRMEVKNDNISVTVALPVDTDTPGFTEEQKTKPLETKLICETGGLCTADTVAKQTLIDAMEKKFISTVGFESFMVKTVCSGMMPFNSLIEIIIQVLTMGIFRIASAFYLFNCYRIIANCCKQTKTASKKD